MQIGLKHGSEYASWHAPVYFSLSTFRLRGKPQNYYVKTCTIWSYLFHTSAISDPILYFFTENTNNLKYPDLPDPDQATDIFYHNQHHKVDFP
jgi:hypothetical protein